jgi:hypothetical protein
MSGHAKYRSKICERELAGHRFVKWKIGDLAGHGLVAGDQQCRAPLGA